MYIDVTSILKKHIYIKTGIFEVFFTNRFENLLFIKQKKTWNVQHNSRKYIRVQGPGLGQINNN